MSRWTGPDWHRFEPAAFAPREKGRNLIQCASCAISGPSHVKGMRGGCNLNSKFKSGVSHLPTDLSNRSGLTRRDTHQVKMTSSYW